MSKSELNLFSALKEKTTCNKLPMLSVKSPPTMYNGNDFTESETDVLLKNSVLRKGEYHLVKKLQNRTF